MCKGEHKRCVVFWRDSGLYQWNTNLFLEVMLTSLQSKGERNLERYVSGEFKINIEGSLW